jgi:hypothetical protein
MYLHNDKAENFQCVANPSEKCVGQKCHAWMLRQYEDKDNDGNAKTRTDPGSGVCGWLYVMSYFRDKNPNKML